MKQCYTFLIAVFACCGAVIVPLRSDAQCSCPNGDPIDSVVHTRTLSGILPFNSNIAFPRFHPDSGMLSCVRMSGLVNTTLNMDLVNRDNTARVTYEMFYTRVTTLTGPGISVTGVENRNYGPYDLGQATVDPDSSVHIGPDTIFQDRFITQQTSNVVPYVGTTGNVVITYYNNGSYLMTQGNDNFGLDVAASSVVNLRLVYYWCPNIVLANTISKFSVIRRDGQVHLQWTVNNDPGAITYTVEYSTDGRRFHAINEQAARGNGSQSYNYAFDPSLSSGNLYFRIRQVDSKGKVSYSVVKALSYTENGVLQTTLYPNPAVRDMTVHFASPQTGRIDIQLVNAAGQVLEQQAMKTLKATTLQVNLGRKHTPGFYWVRVRNRDTGEQSVTRLSLQ